MMSDDSQILTQVMALCYTSRVNMSDYRHYLLVFLQPCSCLVPIFQCFKVTEGRRKSKLVQYKVLEKYQTMFDIIFYMKGTLWHSDFAQRRFPTNEVTSERGQKRNQETMFYATYSNFQTYKQVSFLEYIRKLDLFISLTK